MPEIPVHRYAVYFVPPARGAWAEAGARWLGRCIDTGAPRRQPLPDGWSESEFAAATALPRRYGWHATLKAPFRLAAGRDEAELGAALRQIAAKIESFDLPGHEVRVLDDFIALQPSADCSALRDLADRCVRDLHHLAAPLDAPELARQRRHDLTPGQDALLREWSYPFVFQYFRFHMTLSGSLADVPALRRKSLLGAAERHFAGLPRPLRVAAISLCVEPVAGAAFQRIDEVALCRV